MIKIVGVISFLTMIMYIVFALVNLVGLIGQILGWWLIPIDFDKTYYMIGQYFLYAGIAFIVFLIMLAPDSFIKKD